MKLSAPALTSLSRCERRFQLERQYQVLKRRPREVFNQLLMQAMLRLGGDLQPKAIAEDMSAELMEHGAHPGYDTNQDAYTLTRDLCAAAHTVLEYISRSEHPRLYRPAPDPRWEFSCLAQQDGTLERWISVESWDDDERARQLHSWYVYGDCCAARQPMNIHVIEIGPLRNSHYHSDWTRCFKHPALPNVYRFRKARGEKLEASWKPAWLQDFAAKDARDWVDGMQRDEAGGIGLLHVKRPAEKDLDRFEIELLHYGTLIESLPFWRDMLMRRTSCDLPPCPWQPVCYVAKEQDVEQVGGFVKVAEWPTAFVVPAPRVDPPDAASAVRHGLAPIPISAQSASQQQGAGRHSRGERLPQGANPGAPGSTRGS